MSPLLVSAFRSVAIIAVCVALNSIGGLLSREVGSILFLDLVGTAIASLVYGPIHGALVGFISNGISQYIGIQYYFLFAPVQAVSAATWGILPRLLRGRYCTDFFNDGKEVAAGATRYGYAHLLWGFLWVSFVSNLLASATIAFLITIYSHDLSCGAAYRASDPALQPEVILCDAAKLLFLEKGNDFTGALWKIAAAKSVFGWPDQLIALAVAVVLVTATLPLRRYRMGGVFGLSFVTQRRKAAIVFAFAFVVLSLLRIYFARVGGDDSAAFWDLLVLVVFANLLLLLFVTSEYDFDVFEDDLETDSKKYVFPEVNDALERAFEDSLKFIAIFSVGVIWFFKHRCDTLDCTTTISFLGAGDKDKVTGFLGVVVLITFVRYLSLIVSRAARAALDRRAHDRTAKPCSVSCEQNESCFSSAAAANPPPRN